MNTDNDELVLRLLARDDEKAMTLLYQQYHTLLLEKASHFIQDEDAAQDVVQELWITVWTKRHTLQIRKPVIAYLQRAIYNRSVNYLKSRKLPDNLDYIVLDVPPDIEKDLAEKELKWRFRAIQKQLPYKARLTFLLSRECKMSYKEIAAHLQVSQKAVEKNISIALKMFRKLLKVSIIWFYFWKN
ncbi:sigma-70 family RNA polymerase sigma factor [Rapidithrix thailandica]|uniref:Sigma-70 family RNA polymerase sigma factor n=1 Tax=Rapidithrix thailandica TaxID=413964 RepID=A0AAW9SGV8_9BACT